MGEQMNSCFWGPFQGTQSLTNARGVQLPLTARSRPQKGERFAVKLDGKYVTARKGDPDIFADGLQVNYTGLYPNYTRLFRLLIASALGNQ